MLRVIAPKGPLLFVLATLIPACVAARSPGQRLTDTAYDLNTAARFGRMDIAVESVSKASLAAFASKHRAWGREVRIVDFEFGGFELRDKGLASVAVSIVWQRADESSVRTTEIAQKWEDTASGWRLVDETRASGDFGLLSDAAPPGSAREDARPALSQAVFRTKVISEE